MIPRSQKKIAIEPACLKALAQLERITTLDEFTFADWLRSHHRSLNARFMFSGEPDGEVGAWVRFEYVRELGRIP